MLIWDLRLEGMWRTVSRYCPFKYLVLEAAEKTSVADP
jgi:hypothetical protein